MVKLDDKQHEVLKETIEDYINGYEYFQQETKEILKRILENNIFTFEEGTQEYSSVYELTEPLFESFEDEEDLIKYLGEDTADLVLLFHEYII